jgi:hypothetical protein
MRLKKLGFPGIARQILTRIAYCISGGRFQRPAGRDLPAEDPDSGEFAVSDSEYVPGPDLLSRFLLGTLSRDERLEVERYLESHPSAADTLRGLAPTADTFLVALQAAPAAPSSAPEVRDIVESAKRLAALTGMTHLADSAQAVAASPVETPIAYSEPPADLVSFLAPAEQPDELGRLGGYRILRVMVDPRKPDWDVMASIGHELQHAVEVLSNASLTTMAAVYLFFSHGQTSGDSFETSEAIKAGNSVRNEVGSYAKRKLS